MIRNIEEKTTRLIPNNLYRLLTSAAPKPHKIVFRQNNRRQRDNDTRMNSLYKRVDREKSFLFQLLILSSYQRISLSPNGR